MLSLHLLIALSLADVRQLVASQSRQLAITAADQAIAEAHVSEQRGLDDPRFDAWATHQLGTLGALHRSGVKVLQPIPSGGSVALSLEQQTGDPARTQAQLSFSHALLKGVGVSVARAPRLRAEIARDQAIWSTRASVVDATRSAVGGYFELYFALREAAIREQSAELASQQLEATLAGVAVGKAPDSAAFEVRTIMLNRQALATEARQQVTERTMHLCALLALPMQPLVAEALPEDDKPHLALADNPLLHALQAQVDLQRFEQRIAGNDRLPQFDVSVSVGPAGVGASLSDAYAGLWRGYVVIGSASLSLPIPNRQAQGRVAAAELASERSLIALQDARAQLEQRAQSALAQHENASTRVAIAREGVTNARADVASERARFAAGRSSNWDVLRRQDWLVQAELQQERALVDRLLASAELRALSGEIP